MRQATNALGLLYATGLGLTALARPAWALPAQSARDPDPPAATQAPASPKADAPVEVSVHGPKRSSDDIGGDALKPAEARTTPGTFGDPFQALAALPGIAPMASGLPYFYLRGAPPADTGYFIDGIPVPALFHIGPGPSYVPPALLSRVELYPSTAPAEYGRFVGGIMTGEFQGPVFSAPPRGEASLRLFDASAFVDAPLGDTWDVVAAGRYGYPNLLLSLFAPNLSLGYADYTLRLAHRLSDSDVLSVLALGGYDHESDASQSLPPINSQFHRVDLRLDHVWGTGKLRVATTFGYDRTTGFETYVGSQTDASTSTRLRLELEQRLGDAASLRVGADASTSHFAFGSTGEPTRAIGDEETLGVHLALHFTLAPGVEIVPGLRLDDTVRAAGLPGGSGVTTDPRLAARVALTKDIAWISTMGVAHQEPAYVLPIPGAVVSSPDGFQHVDQLAAGFEGRLPEENSREEGKEEQREPWKKWLDGVTAKVTAFYNAEHNVSDFIAACGELLSCGPVGSANGRTYGVEVLLRRELVHGRERRLGGWLSYTLSRAERYLGNAPYLSPFDRTHELSAVLHYDFGGGFSAGLRASYYTGRPDFPSLSLPASPGAAGGAAAAGQAAPQIAFGPGQIAEHRLPSYYRVDWRLAKSWRALSGRIELSAVAEFFNTTLTKEAVEFLCSPVQNKCAASYVGPIALPSIGIEGRW